MTQQPAGGRPEGGYVQPQDPWGGFEPGVASMPTDPIPHEPYPAGQSGQIWAQPTVAHGAPYAYQPPRRRIGRVILVSVLVLVVAGGAGYLAYRLASGTGTPVANPTGTPGTHTTTPPASEPAFDPHTVSAGDCVFNRGTEKQPKLSVVSCETPGSYEVLKVVTGAELVEGPNGEFDAANTSVAACKGTGYKTWYGYKDAVDDTQDVFFCMSAKSS